MRLSLVAVMMAVAACTPHFDQMEYMREKAETRNMSKTSVMGPVEITAKGVCELTRRKPAREGGYDVYYMAPSELFYDLVEKKFVGTERIENVLLSHGVNFEISSLVDPFLSYVRITVPTRQESDKVKLILKHEKTLEEYSPEIASSFEWREARMASMTPEQLASRERRAYSECEKAALKDARQNAEAQAKAMGVRIRGLVGRMDEVGREHMTITLQYAIK